MFRFKYTYPDPSNKRKIIFNYCIAANSEKAAQKQYAKYYYMIGQYLRHEGFLFNRDGNTKISDDRRMSCEVMEDKNEIKIKNTNNPWKRKEK